MGSLDELEQRIAAMEAKLAVVRQEAAVARALAAGADRDVAEYRAELRGHTRVLWALRETQLEKLTKFIPYAPSSASSQFRGGCSKLFEIQIRTVIRSPGDADQNT